MTRSSTPSTSRRSSTTSSSSPIVIGRSRASSSVQTRPNDYIAGFTVFNDITARDIQRREMQSGVFSFSKAIDTFCPIGPWIVTKDDVPNRRHCRWSYG